jgi:hypothetical protein
MTGRPCTFSPLHSLHDTSVICGASICLHILDYQIMLFISYLKQINSKPSLHCNKASAQ